MDDKSPILIVGVGSIGERHLRCFQAGSRVPLSICDTNSRLREEVAKRYGIERSGQALGGQRVFKDELFDQKV